MLIEKYVVILSFTRHLSLGSVISNFVISIEAYPNVPQLRHVVHHVYFPALRTGTICIPRNTGPTLEIRT